MGSRERVNRQTDRDSTAIGRSGRRRVEIRRGRLVDQEAGAEEQTGRQGLGGRQDSQKGRDQRTGRTLRQAGIREQAGSEVGQDSSHGKAL